MALKNGMMFGHSVFLYFIYYKNILKLRKRTKIMVKIGLKIKNGSKIFKPKKGDVVIFDGKEWYITTKDDIFAEYQEKVDAKLQEVEQELEAMRQYRGEVSSQIAELGSIVKDFIKSQGE